MLLNLSFSLIFIQVSSLSFPFITELVFCKRGVLRNFAKFTGKRLCQSPFFNNFIKKEVLAQVFSREFSEISKNTFFHRTPLVAASVFLDDSETRNSYTKQRSVSINTTETSIKYRKYSRENFGYNVTL